jgi:pilus assembly protein CpaC
MSFVKHTGRPVTKVSIADAEVVDATMASPTQVLLVAKDKTEVTSLILWYDDDHAEVFEVVVRLPDSAWKDIQEAVDRLVPNARVKVERLGDGVALDGFVESQGDLDRVLEITKRFVSNFTNMISVQGSQQVQLEVKVAEVSRSGLKQLGLGFLLDKNWKIGVFPSGSITGTLESGRQSDIIQATPTMNITTYPDGSTRISTYDNSSATNTLTSELLSSTTLSSPFSSAFQVLAHGMDDDILAIMSLLKSQGLSRLLASPTLVAMNGQEAKFLVGGEFPYPVEGSEGETTISFKEFGVMLEFVPFLVGKETMTLKVSTEVSSPDYSTTVVSGGVSVPGMSSRRGETTLQLKDGQTFAMAGLIREETRSSVNKIPFLGDIPILGTLFTSKEFQTSESELVIIVTPRIVRPLNPEEVPPLPGSRLGGDVSDLDFFIHNRVLPEGPSAPDSPAARAPKFVGEVGFVRE